MSKISIYLQVAIFEGKLLNCTFSYYSATVKPGTETAMNFVSCNVASSWSNRRRHAIVDWDMIFEIFVLVMILLPF